MDQCCWHPAQQDQLATASGDKSVRFWDTRAGKCVAPVATSGEIINLAWSPDGAQVVVGDKADCLTVIDARTYGVLHATKFEFEVNEFRWDRQGRFLVTTGRGTVEVLAFPGWKPLHTLVAHAAGCYVLALDSRGRRLAVGGADAVVSVWDVDRLACSHTVARLDKPVRALSFSHDGRFLAAGSQDHFIDISVADTGEVAARIDTRAEINSLAWNPRHLLLAFAVGDEVRLTEEGLAFEPRTGGEGALRVWGPPLRDP